MCCGIAKKSLACRSNRSQRCVGGLKGVPGSEAARQDFVVRLSGALRELSESGKDRGTSEVTESASSSLGTPRGFQPIVAGGRADSAETRTRPRQADRLSLLWRG